MVANSGVLTITIAMCGGINAIASQMALRIAMQIVMQIVLQTAMQIVVANSGVLCWQGAMCRGGIELLTTRHWQQEVARSRDTEYDIKNFTKRYLYIKEVSEYDIKNMIPKEYDIKNIIQKEYDIKSCLPLKMFYQQISSQDPCSEYYIKRYLRQP